MKNSQILVFLFSMLLLFSCSSQQVTDNGSGTGTGNPIYTGVAVSSSGTTLSNAPIRVFRNDVKYDSSDIAYLGDEFNVSGTVYTNQNGSCTFSILEQGEFRIELTTNDENEAVSFLVTVDSSMSPIRIDTLQTAPLDTLRGTVTLVDLEMDEDNDTITISAMGTNRSITVISGQEFAFPLPRGEFTLVVTPKESEYSEKIYPYVASNGIIDIAFFESGYRSTSYETDTTIVRSILDENGIDTVSAKAVTIRYFLSRRVNEIELQNLPIHTIPEQIGALTALNELEIRNTDITTLPPEIGNLTQLTELELDNNNLTSLPVEISNLTNLQELKLGGNYIDILPEEVSLWADSLSPYWKESQRSRKE